MAGTERRLLRIDRMYRVAVATYQHLLQRNAGAAIAAAVLEVLRMANELPPTICCDKIANVQRPDLAALMLGSGRGSSNHVAKKQFYPDTEFYGRYDSFSGNRGDTKRFAVGKSG